MTTSALMELDARLDSKNTVAVLAAAWDAFTLAAEVADAITFEEGSDELQAMAAAQQSMAGRDLLPLPQSGWAVEATAPAPGAAGLDRHVHLLEHVSGSLTRLSSAAVIDVEAARSLGRAAELAAGAALALSQVRGH
ncbi:hypothetical protein OHA91_39595 (plasmid) [Streptomyces erythrochromogenes]|uniref:Uncharacterized protein n=1 Tax=Streptomyces erythrochromogenes TaxID=285574 RepID=A0ABZ1QPP9_9ACTN|nr:hypothetical protein [Streptomyces erythrochromogenes]